MYYNNIITLKVVRIMVKIKKHNVKHLFRCHIIHRPHPKNHPRLSRDNKIDYISLNTHTNRFKFKPHITSMHIHTCGKKSTSNYALK